MTLLDRIFLHLALLILGYVGKVTIASSILVTEWKWDCSVRANAHAYAVLS
jgi:hypothetical protein